MQNVTFNIPPKTGAELSYIEKAIESNKICGDGEFTKKCSQWMENAFSAKKVLLTGKRAILVCGTGIGMSIAANPILCLVLSYSFVGFPKPTIIYIFFILRNYSVNAQTF